MIKLAEFQKLTIERMNEHGAYLTDGAEGSRVLLPGREVPEGEKPGDELDVFVYRDSEDRPIATLKRPLVTLGHVAALTVKSVTKIGAFLDWGLDKDLFLPFAQQTYKVKENDKIPVAVYLDKSSRIAATMKIYPYLEKLDEYGAVPSGDKETTSGGSGEKRVIKRDDEVTGTVYEISDNFGAFVAVEDRFQGLIPKRELYGEIRPGMHISARVTAIRPDGKIDLSVRQKAYLQIEEDAAKLIEILKSYDGVLPFTDKASPEVIKRETGMSKNEFKRAVGNLYRNHIITIADNNTIRLV